MPRNEAFIILVLFLVLIGLVLTTTCVDIVGAYYIDRLHFFGRRLEDVSNLLSMLFGLIVAGTDYVSQLL